MNEVTPSFEQKEAYSSLLCVIEPCRVSQIEDTDLLKTELGAALRKAGVELSPQARLVKNGKDNKWELLDDEQRYEVRKKAGDFRIYENSHVINKIVERDLCVRCGACEPACPADIIRFDKECFPYITDEALCPTACTRCLKVCPGEFVNFSGFDQEMFGCSPHPDSITGVAHRAIISYATDDYVREDGTSGGLITQLLVFLLEQGHIDGALVLGSGKNAEAWSQESYIARTSDDIKKATKSKYMVTPYLRPLKEIEEVEGRYAVVALPCYIHSLRKYQRVSKKLRDRIKLVIGLFCNAAFIPDMYEEVTDVAKLDKSSIKDFHFRHGEWPGGLTAEFASGEKKPVLKLQDMRDEFNLMKMLYTAPRCHMCIDYSAEHADISVGDPWLRDKTGKLMYKDNHSTALIRTEAGDWALNAAQDAGYLKTDDIPLEMFMVNFENLARYKRTFVPEHIAIRKNFDLSFADYNRPIGNTSNPKHISALKKLSIIHVTRIPWMRKLLLRMVQTSLALKYLDWNRDKKDRVFARKYSRLSAMADKFKSHLKSTQKTTKV